MSHLLMTRWTEVELGIIYVAPKDLEKDLQVQNRKLGCRGYEDAGFITLDADYPKSIISESVLSVGNIKNKTKTFFSSY